MALHLFLEKTGLSNISEMCDGFTKRIPVSVWSSEFHSIEARVPQVRGGYVPMCVLNNTNYSSLVRD